MINPNSTVKVHFIDVAWTSKSLPTSFEKEIRCEFMLDHDGSVFKDDDLHDVFAAYLQDEYGECPLKFDFALQF